ncbi:MAG: hypothetical protein IPK82_30380 [Polyangiaceae bacterium]|nr:hypothetical protein [Polyangiaceae bacterium]
MPSAPDALEQVLGALWCNARFENAAMAVAQDPAAKLSRPSAKNPSARLRAVVMDATSPVLLRKRALGLYVTAAQKEGAWAEALSTLVSLASDATAATANRRMRTAALRLLLDVRASAKGVDKKKIDAAIDAAKASSDTLVAHVAAGH